MTFCRGGNCYSVNFADQVSDIRKIFAFIFFGELFALFLLNIGYRNEFALREFMQNLCVDISHFAGADDRCAKLLDLLGHFLFFSS